MRYRVQLRLKNLLLILSLVPLQCIAQSVVTDVVKSEQDYLWGKIELTNDRVKQLLEHATDKNNIARLFLGECNNLQSPQQLKAQALSAKANTSNDDIGLELRAGYTSGRQGDNLNDENDNAYLELNWNLLREGYQNRMSEAVALRNKSEATRIKGEFEYLKRQNHCRRQTINNSFSSLQTPLLLAKLELMEPVFKVERRAYFMGWSLLDDLLVSEADLYNIRQTLKSTNQSELIDRKPLLTERFNPPLIELDLSAIINAIETDKRSIQLRHAEIQTARYKTKAEAQRDRLRVFVRQSFTEDTNGLEDDGLAAGIRYIMPLSSEADTTLDYELKSIDANAEINGWQRLARTRTAYVSFQEQHTRVSTQQFRYLRAAERLRRSIVGRDVSAASIDVTTAVIQARSLLDASLELVKAKEELYQRANEVLLQAQVEFDASLFKISALPDQKYRARPLHRAVYLWSASFNQVDNKRLWQFLDTKGVQRVLLSAGSKTKRDKMGQFISTAKEKDVDIGLMIGDNEWIFERNWQKALQRSARMAEFTGHLHLDIEPHTLAGYKKHRRQYLDAYFNLIRGIRKVMAPGDTLSLSVPIHWDIQDYVRLNGLADELFFMAYEQPVFSKLEKRLAPIFEVLPAKRITVALRPQDFENEWALEQMIMNIEKRFDIRRIAIHDARTYMAMPKAKQ